MVIRKTTLRLSKLNSALPPTFSSALLSAVVTVFRKADLASRCGLELHMKITIYGIKN